MAALVNRQHARRVETAPGQGGQTHDASMSYRELLERVNHGVKEANDVLVRLVAR